MIAAGSSTDGPGRHKISLWKQNMHRETSKPKRTAISALWVIVQLAMAMATLVLICQSVVKSVSNPLPSKKNLLTRVPLRSGLTKSS
jgi:hypothetical protein